MPITKKQFIDSIIPFIYSYDRLPYMDEDDITVEVKNDDGELESRPYRSSKYIKEFFKNTNKLTDFLFKENILTHEIVSNHTGIETRRLKELLKGGIKNITTNERRAIHIFFNNDSYKNLGEVNKECIDCTKAKKCGQEYWVTVVSCSNRKTDGRKNKIQTK